MMKCKIGMRWGIILNTKNELAKIMDTTADTL